MILTYQAAYWFDDSGWVMAQVLDFPGAVSQGRGIAHAREMLQSAMLEMLECLIERGQPLPIPDKKTTTQTEDSEKPADIEEPIYLLFEAASRFRAVPATPASFELAAT